DAAHRGARRSVSQERDGALRGGGRRKGARRSRRARIRCVARSTRCTRGGRAQPLPDADLSRNRRASRLPRPRRSGRPLRDCRGTARGCLAGTQDRNDGTGEDLDRPGAGGMGGDPKTGSLGLEPDLAAPSLSSVPGGRKLVAASRPEETARLLAERRSPSDDRPALRKDLSVLRQVQMGEVLWIVKNPATMKYYQFRNAQWQLIRLFDGRRSRAQVLTDYNRWAGEYAIPLERVLEYEDFLRERELIEQTVAERNITLLDKYKSLRHKKAEEGSEGFNPFFIMFHVVDPDRFLTRTVKYVQWIWTPPVAIATLVASIWTGLIFARHWGPLW